MTLLLPGIQALSLHLRLSPSEIAARGSVEGVLTDLYTSTKALMPCAPNNIQGRGVTSILVDDDEPLLRNAEDSPVGDESLPPIIPASSFNKPCSYCDSVAAVGSSTGTTDLVLPFDAKIWARALAPPESTSSNGARIATKNSDPSSSYPYLLSNAGEELVQKNNAGPTPAPALLFLHGSFHSPDCFAESFFPFFTSRGIGCEAVPLRGIASGFPASPSNKRNKVRVEEHVEDLSKYLAANRGKEYILVAHSFAGILLMKTLQGGQHPNVRNVCLLCSVPPSGNGPMTKRFLFRNLKLSYQITVGLALKKVTSNADLCRTLFFDESLTDSSLRRWMKGFSEDSETTIDLLDLGKQLPSSSPSPQNLFSSSPLVIGANGDKIVDKEGVLETADFFGTKPVFVDSPHDVMLGGKWENTAYEILQWYRSME